VLKTGAAHQLPKNDTYGALYFHLLEHFTTFSERLQRRDLAFTLLTVDARKLPFALAESRNKHGLASFDRIDVSNITDRGWVGLPDTLSSLGRLLKSRTENPHATLLTLFLNYHAEADMLSPPSEAESSAAIFAIAKLLTSRPMRSHLDPLIAKLAYLNRTFRDTDKQWAVYTHATGFWDAARAAGMKKREKGRIIEELPFKLDPGKSNEALLEQLDLMELGQLAGHERYVEWVRAE